MPTPIRYRLALPVAAAVFPLLLLAQYQVNTQVYRGGSAGPASGAVRYSSTYGYGNTINNASAGMMLPSQVRYATWTSGALPSEARMQARAVGPLAASGSVAYVPPPANYRPPQAPTQGNYVNPQVSARTAPAVGNVGAVGSAPGGYAPPIYGTTPGPIPTTPVTGSVRYSAPGAPGVEVTPFNTLTSSSNSGVPIGQTMGSIKYAP